jgi:hypothetical protein
MSASRLGNHVKPASKEGQKATWSGATRKGRSVVVWAFITVSRSTARPTI